MLGEVLVMKKLFALFLIGIVCFALAGCSSSSKTDIEIGKKSEYLIRDDFVSMEVNNFILDNSSAIFRLINHTDEIFVYGNPYFIEYNKDGVWYELKPIGELNFNLPAFQLVEGESKEIAINWSGAYGELKPGSYRVVKGFNRESNIVVEQDDVIYVAAELTIK